MVQELLAKITVLFAAAWLVYRFFVAPVLQRRGPDVDVRALTRRGKEKKRGPDCHGP